MEIRPGKLISSRDNTIFRELIDCQNSKGIKRHGLYVVSGRRAVLENIRHFPEHCRSLLLAQMPPNTETIAVDKELAELACPLHNGHKDESRARFSILGFSRELFHDLDLFGTGAPLLMMAAPDLPAQDLSEAPRGVEILCALGDPSNVGALLRSAAAFGASKVILLKESASAFHPKAVRSASAATLRTPLFSGPSILDPKMNSDKTVALDMQGESIFEFKWPKDVRLLVGEEGQGVPSEFNFRRLAIPLAGGVESLNASTAVGIALFNYRSQQY